MTAHYDEPNDVTLTEYRVSKPPEDDETRLPEYILDRTANILSLFPMTNQSIILDLTIWWYENAGNCAIYKWCVHHLDGLENGDHLNAANDQAIYSNAKEQAEEIGFDDEVAEKVEEQS
jgi:hypothetical protein